jgi:predicted 3-demethylubiquinone-9 3-methyltransferase (glyoxalase superfamily)
MTKLGKTTPHLWFDKEAKEAAAFYTSVLRDSEIKNTTKLHQSRCKETAVFKRRRNCRVARGS